MSCNWFDVKTGIGIACVQVRLLGPTLQRGPNCQRLNVIYEAFKAFWWVPHAQGDNTLFFYSHWTHSTVLRVSVNLVFGSVKQHKNPKTDLNGTTYVLPQSNVLLLWWKPARAEQCWIDVQCVWWFRIQLTRICAVNFSAAHTSSLKQRRPLVSASLVWTPAGSAEVKAADFLLMKCLLTVVWRWVGGGLLPTRRT